ncbi:MAG TPA: tetratricopeptide repeat protein, partial [Hanamia sp.]
MAQGKKLDGLFSFGGKIIVNFIFLTTFNQISLLMHLFDKLKKNYLQILIICLFTMGITTGCHQKTGSDNTNTNGDPKQLALQYLSQNKLDEAVAAFQQAIKKNPDDTSSYIGLTRLYLLQQNYDAAENLCMQGLKVQPNNIDLKLLLAETYARKNDKENAIKELNEIIQQDPKNIGAYYQLAEIDTSSQNALLRKSYLLKVQSLSPANIIPRIQLAELFANEGKTDSSLSYLQSIKKMAPGFSNATETAYENAASLLHANKPDEALAYIQQFHALMKITPEYSSGLDEITIPRMVA